MRLVQSWRHQPTDSTHHP